MSRQPKSPSSYHPYFVFPGNSRSHSSSGACPSTAVLAPSSMAPQPFSNWNGRSGFGKAPTLKGRRLPPPPTQNSMYHESRYKTELCRQFEEIGHCEYGDRCLFAHGVQELKALPNRHPKFKTERCSSYHEFGFCSFGPRCSFIHEKPNPEEIIHKLASCIPNSIPACADEPKKKGGHNIIDKENTEPLLQALLEVPAINVANEERRLPIFTRICP